MNTEELWRAKATVLATANIVFGNYLGKVQAEIDGDSILVKLQNKKLTRCVERHLTAIPSTNEAIKLLQEMARATKV